MYICKAALWQVCYVESSGWCHRCPHFSSPSYDAIQKLKKLEIYLYLVIRRHSWSLFEVNQNHFIDESSMLITFKHECDFSLWAGACVPLYKDVYTYAARLLLAFFQFLFVCFISAKLPNRHLSRNTHKTYAFKNTDIHHPRCSFAHIDIY